MKHAQQLEVSDALLFPMRQLLEGVISFSLISISAQVLSSLQIGNTEYIHCNFIAQALSAATTTRDAQWRRRLVMCPSNNKQHGDAMNRPPREKV
jgi:hypothetical protein